MRMIGFVVLLMLLLASSEFVFGSSFSLTVETGKQCYLRWEYVNVSGYLTYNDWGVQGCLVALAVKNPSNNTIIMETAVTGEFGEYNFSFRLSNETEFGTYTVYVNYQEAGNSTIFQVNELLGDVNGDGKVDLKDIYKVAYAYGSDPGLPNWDQACDINHDGKVDERDYYIVCKNYGKP